VSQGWDEFFLNLRHSFWLAHGQGYSANALSHIESTVDFIPFFSIGVLGALGLPMPELAILYSLAGTALTMAVLEGHKDVVEKLLNNR
jgi:hypothetical protein